VKSVPPGERGVSSDGWSAGEVIVCFAAGREGEEMTIWAWHFFFPGLEDEASANDLIGSLRELTSWAE
jgi:hypothetical protein